MQRCIAGPLVAEIWDDLDVCEHRTPTAQERRNTSQENEEFKL
jgi:hypothetical protein